jgi:hypothetical protein
MTFLENKFEEDEPFCPGDLHKSFVKAIKKASKLEEFRLEQEKYNSQTFDKYMHKKY